jgi:hypothetical protein
MTKRRSYEAGHSPKFMVVIDDRSTSPITCPTIYSTHTAPSVDWIARDQGEVSHDRKSHMPNL